LTAQLTLPSDVFRAVFWFIVVYNVKPLKGHMVRSLNPVLQVNKLEYNKVTWEKNSAEIQK
jgi:hypothetical protein